MMKAKKQIGQCLKTLCRGGRLVPPLWQHLSTCLRLGILALCAMTLVPQVDAAVGDSFSDALFQYTVLTEEGTTGTVSVGKRSSAIPEGEVSIPSTVSHGEVAYTVTTIREEAFSYCYFLISVGIPESVTTIGVGAFSGCTPLTRIEVDAENPNYSSMDGVLFNKDKTTLIRCPQGKEGAYTIPESVTSIWGDEERSDGAFCDCTHLTSIVIPTSVTTMGDFAFSGCKRLTSVMLPDSVTFVGDSVFLACTSLTSIVIPESVTTIGNWTFGSCTGLTSIVIPDSVTTLGSRVFAGCESLISIELGDNVTSMGDYAFCECYSLPSIVIPESVTTIGMSAFGCCESLTSIVLGDNVTSIADYAFCECKSLPSIVIPESVTTIGMNAFLLCEKLTSVVLGNGVTTIGTGAFSFCTKLTSIEIPDNVTTIGAQAFNSCSSLRSGVIGNGVTSIESNAFGRCDGLESVYFKGNAPELGSGVFMESYPTLYYVEGTTGWTNPWGERPTATWVPGPVVEPEPVVDPETGERIGFTITYPPESRLEESLDLKSWTLVKEVTTPGTYVVLVQKGSRQKFYRSVQGETGGR